MAAPCVDITSSVPERERSHFSWIDPMNRGSDPRIHGLHATKYLLQQCMVSSQMLDITVEIQPNKRKIQTNQTNKTKGNLNHHNQSFMALHIQVINHVVF